MGEAFLRRGEHERAIEYLQRALTLLGKSLPTSSLMLWVAIIEEIAKQMIHRLLFSMFSAVNERSVANDVEEECRLYESLGLIEGFRNYERYILLLLRMLTVLRA